MIYQMFCYMFNNYNLIIKPKHYNILYSKYVIFSKFKYNILYMIKKRIKNKNAIIDGNSIFMRYFYAIPEKFNSDGIPVHGLLAFCRFILNFIRDYNPSSVLVVFDKCYNNFRKQISPEYKVNRTKLSDSAKDQLNLSFEFCQKSGIPVEFHSEYEGDDLIGSFVHQNPSEEFIIMSTDKDLCQLVQSNVYIFNPFTKTLIDQDFVYTKYNVPARHFHLFLALTGDSSDNIKGIPGVGPKTAAKILSYLSDYDDIHKVMPMFPKYDFSDWNMQLQLTCINKEVQLSNPNPSSINLNQEFIQEFFRIFDN